jgi:hypothetical protein
VQEGDKVDDSSEMFEEKGSEGEFVIDISGTGDWGNGE